MAQFHSTRDQGVLYHHMVRDEHTDLRVFSEITELAVRIDNPATAPALIDAALQTCLTASRPVYIELASQTALMACSPAPAGRDGAVLVGRGLAYWGDVGLEPLIDALLDALSKAGGPLPNAPFPGLEGSPWQIPPPSDFPAADPISFGSFRSLLQHEFLEGHDEEHYPQIVADSGFSFLANIGLKCGAGGYVAQLAWAAIGYGVGATTGVNLANELVGRTRRTVTITGDGAFAEALNALGTIAQLGQDPIVFVMDNRVFAVEQWLINANAFCPANPPPFAPLTMVPQGHIWDYVKLAAGFGGQGCTVSTNSELSAVLKQVATPPVNPVTGKPTFTLVAVRLPEKSLPANATWKMTCD